VILDEEPADRTSQPAIGRHERHGEIGGGRRNEGIPEPRDDALGHEPRRSVRRSKARLDHTDVRAPKESVDNGRRGRMYAVGPHQELCRADRAHEASERTLLDTIEKGVHRGEHRARARSLEAVDERRRVAEESAARAQNRGYEPVLSRHGPRSSSTYA
jgi:hypothetical protein